jgi:hypothetical protein
VRHSALSGSQTISLVQSQTDAERILDIVQSGVHDAEVVRRRFADVASEKDGLASFDSLYGKLR